MRNNATTTCYCCAPTTTTRTKSVKIYCIQCYSARSIFGCSRGDCLAVSYLLVEASLFFVLCFPPPEIGQIFGCLGRFVRGKAILRAQKYTHARHNGSNTEMLAHILGDFCARTDFCVPLTDGLTACQIQRPMIWTPPRNSGGIP